MAAGSIGSDTKLGRYPGEEQPHQGWCEEEQKVGLGHMIITL
jgi:hypothetical protein